MRHGVGSKLGLTTEQGSVVWKQQMRQNCPIVVHGKARFPSHPFTVFLGLSRAASGKEDMAAAAALLHGQQPYGPASPATPIPLPQSTRPGLWTETTGLSNRKSFRKGTCSLCKAKVLGKTEQQVLLLFSR